ncbi:MAG: hypothetical protein WCP21_13030, partial [Armatimonadota bacterium]
MSELVAEPPLRLVEDDLLSVLRPRVLVALTAITFVFAIGCLFLHVGQWMLLGLVVFGAVLAFVSPEYAFALCVFLFAFR